MSFKDFFFGFSVGTRVRVEVDDLDQLGVVGEISTDPEVGYGTKLYPTYLVDFDDGTWGWFNGISLTRSAVPRITEPHQEQMASESLEVHDFTPAGVQAPTIAPPDPARTVHQIDRSAKRSIRFVDTGVVLSPSLIDGNEDRAVRVLQAYFSPLSGANTGYTGGVWDRFDPSGRREGTVNEFTADDVLAPSLLAAPIQGRAAMDLLELRRQEFTELLEAIGPDRDFYSVGEVESEDFAPVRRLLTALLSLPQTGETRATKLIARKRPRLVPIVDSVIIKTAFPGLGRQWGPFHDALHADNGDLHDRLVNIRHAAGLGDGIPVIRVFDVLIWMDGSGNSERVLQAAPR